MKKNKIKNSKFQKSKTVLLGGPLRRNFRKSLKGFKSDLREEYRFEVLTPIGSHVNENEKKKILRNQKIFFFKNEKKMCGHMAQGKPQLKFERNLRNNFRDNGCHRRTTDSRQPMDNFPYSADRVKQS